MKYLCYIVIIAVLFGCSDGSRTSDGDRIKYRIENAGGQVVMVIKGNLEIGFSSDCKYEMNGKRYLLTSGSIILNNGDKTEILINDYFIICKDVRINHSGVKIYTGQQIAVE